MRVVESLLHMLRHKFLDKSSFRCHGTLTKRAHFEINHRLKFFSIPWSYQGLSGLPVMMDLNFKPKTAWGGGGGGGGGGGQMIQRLSWLINQPTRLLYLKKQVTWPPGLLNCLLSPPGGYGVGRTNLSVCLSVKPLLHPIVRARTSWLQREISWFARDTSATCAILWQNVKVAETLQWKLACTLFSACMQYGYKRIHDSREIYKRLGQVRFPC